MTSFKKYFHYELFFSELGHKIRGSYHVGSLMHNLWLLITDKRCVAPQANALEIRISNHYSRKVAYYKRIC